MKNDIKWDMLDTKFMNVVSNYPLTKWWRESLISFFPASSLPKGVLELATRLKEKEPITNTFRIRNKKKLSGLSEEEVRCQFFGSKIEMVAKEAIKQVSIFYNSLYRAHEKLPSSGSLYRAMKRSIFESPILRGQKTCFLSSFWQS